MLNNEYGNPLILLVEDDEDHFEFVKRSLGKSLDEYHLEQVATLRQAREFIDRRTPDLVLTDYKLPDGCGSELIQLADGRFPIVLLTSHGNERIAVELMKAGVQDYIVKSPETFELLPQTIKYALNTWNYCQERLQTNEAICRAKREWEQTFDAVPDLIAIIDKNHVITRVNRAMAERCGMKPEELFGKVCYEVVHGLKHPPLFCPHIKLMQNGFEHKEEVVEKRLDGVFDVSVSPLFDSEGCPRASVHVMRDITARRHLEDDLVNNSLQMKSIFDASSAGILSTTPDYKFSLFNKRITELFGYTAEEFKALTYKQLIHPDHHAEVVHNLHTLLDEPSSSIASERRFLRKDGSTFWGYIIVRKMFGSKGETLGYLGTITDITERKKVEEERLLMEKQFQQTQKLESLGVLAGGIAHDFNNILTIILGHCLMVKEDDGVGEDSKEHVRLIENASNRAADLCRQMLAYAGKSPLVQTQVNLWMLVNEIVIMLKSAIKKNIKIKLDLKRNIPQIIADNSQIQQVVMNLIINSAEAIGDGNGVIDINLKRVDIDNSSSFIDFQGAPIQIGSYACLEVSDNGCGIEEESQKRIFEPFYTTKFTGRGLGLSAILGIIKSHYGALQFISRVGVGTTFKIYFPISVRTDSDELSQDFIAVQGMSSGTVLLVDDEEGVRTVMGGLLTSKGFTVLTAQDGREALEMFQENADSINYVVLDLVMPELGGLETYYGLRRLSTTLPIVICSGYNLDELSEKIAQDCFAGVLQKPYNPSQLIDIWTVMEQMD